MSISYKWMLVFIGLVFGFNVYAGEPRVPVCRGLSLYLHQAWQLALPPLNQELNKGRLSQYQLDDTGCSIKLDKKNRPNGFLPLSFCEIPYFDKLSPYQTQVFQTDIDGDGDLDIRLENQACLDCAKINLFFKRNVNGHYVFWDLASDLGIRSTKLTKHMSLFFPLVNDTSFTVVAEHDNIIGIWAGEHGVMRPACGSILRCPATCGKL